jgi:divalent metal cation (Fe/Co/Zn/Cd) transporter
MEKTLRIAGISVAVSLIVLGLKFLAWRMTGSIALYSDALESLSMSRPRSQR